MGAYGEGLGSGSGFDEEPTTYAMFAGMSKAEGLEPCTIEDAEMRSDLTEWKEAVSAEMKSLDEAHNWDIDVFNFHSAFLNGKLDADEEIYMELPPGVDLGRKTKSRSFESHCMDLSKAH